MTGAGSPPVRPPPGAPPSGGFQPPPYPYDRLHGLKALADELDGGVVDCSIGTPTDPPPAAVVDALATSGAERGYPSSAGGPAYREAAAGWLSARFGVAVDPGSVAACVGTKELVASTAHYLRLRDPGRDTVLYPAVSYPTYAMGATLAGCRAVPVPPATADGAGLDLDAIDPADAARAVLLWVNSPANPSGGLTDLDAAAAWGQAPPRARVLRRVLRRVHLGRATPVRAGGRPRRRRRGPLALEAVQPGRCPGRLLRRRRRARRLPARRPPARRAHGPRTGAGRGGRRPRRPGPRRRPARPLPRTARVPRRRPDQGRHPHRRCRPAASTSGPPSPPAGPTPGRSPTTSPAPAAFSSAPATSTGPRAPATCGSPSSSRSSGSSWSASGSRPPGGSCQEMAAGP